MKRRPTAREIRERLVVVMDEDHGQLVKAFDSMLLGLQELLLTHTTVDNHDSVRAIFKNTKNPSPPVSSRAGTLRRRPATFEEQLRAARGMPEPDRTAYLAGAVDRARGHR